MKKICIIITTFNRPEMLRDLIEDIEKVSGFDILIQLYDDCSIDINSIDNLGSLIGLNFSYYRSHFNHGKKKYFQLVNRAFADIPEADYYFMLPDDVRLMPDFFNKAIAIWEGITTPNKVCLNLDIDGRLGKECWTSFTPVDRGNVYQSQWVDMCFLANKDFFRHVGKFSVGDRWKNNEALGSGCGAAISRIIHQKGLAMYHIKEPLLTHGGHESKMNPL